MSEQIACDRPAVGWIRNSTDEWGEIIDEHPWPAYAWHLNRYSAQALPLNEIALTEGQHEKARV